MTALLAVPKVLPSAVALAATDKPCTAVETPFTVKPALSAIKATAVSGPEIIIEPKFVIRDQFSETNSLFIVCSFLEY